MANATTPIKLIRLCPVWDNRLYSTSTRTCLSLYRVYPAPNKNTALKRYHCPSKKALELHTWPVNLEEYRKTAFKATNEIVVDKRGKQDGKSGRSNVGKSLHEKGFQLGAGCGGRHSLSSSQWSSTWTEQSNYNWCVYICYVKKCHEGYLKNYQYFFHWSNPWKNGSKS